MEGGSVQTTSFDDHQMPTTLEQPERPVDERIEQPQPRPPVNGSAGSAPCLVRGCSGSCTIGPVTR